MVELVERIGDDGRVTTQPTDVPSLPQAAVASAVPHSRGSLETLCDDRPLLARSSAAERVADVLRRRVTDGDLPPGTRLSEEHVVAALEVSRNTLREAFRLLTHEGLLVHVFNRGVFVRQPSVDDVVDVYRLRRIIECDVVRDSGPLTPDQLDALDAEVATAEKAADDGRWRDVGTANMRFHHRLVALADSSRIDELTVRLLAELRLAFHIVNTPRQLHEPYIARNRRIVELLAAGDPGGAADYLLDYLRESEQQILAAYRDVEGRA